MPLTLPVISIAPYVHRTDSNEAERRATSAALHEACVNYGFFYLDISSFASHEETDELERLAHQFFELPQDAKDVISIENEDLARGYQRLKQNVTNGKADAHEGIDFYRPVEQPEKGRPLWGENQWPSDEVVPKFKATYEVWVEKMKQLGLIVHIRRKCPLTSETRSLMSALDQETRVTVPLYWLKTRKMRKTRCF